MPSRQILVVVKLAALSAVLSGCGNFPELEVSEAEFDRTTPYPKLVPMDVLLKEPEPAITDELQSDLTTRRDDLLATPTAADAEQRNDPVLDRLDALRAQQAAREQADALIDDELRKRMEDGIKPPSSSQ